MATWGYTGAGDTDVALTNHVRVCSGDFTTAGQKLDSMTVRGGTTSCAGRLGIYSDAIDDVDGAALLEDLGAVTLPSNDWVTANGVGTTAIPEDFLFLMVKGTNGSGNARKLNGSVAGSNFSAYWENPTGMDPSETVAYSTPAGAESFTTTEAISIYMTHSAVAGGGALGALAGSGGLAGMGGLVGRGSGLAGGFWRGVEELEQRPGWLVRKINGVWCAMRKPVWLPRELRPAHVPWPKYIEPKPRYDLLVPVGISLAGAR